MDRELIDSVFRQAKAHDDPNASVCMSRKTWQGVARYLEGRRPDDKDPWTRANLSGSQHMPGAPRQLAGLPVVFDRRVPLGEAVVR